MSTASETIIQLISGFVVVIYVVSLLQYNFSNPACMTNSLCRHPPSEMSDGGHQIRFLLLVCMEPVDACAKLI